MKTRWAILDDNGIIYEGQPEEELREIFEDPDFEWDGDLLLIEIHRRKR